MSRFLVTMLPLPYIGGTPASLTHKSVFELSRFLSQLRLSDSPWPAVVLLHRSPTALCELDHEVREVGLLLLAGGLTAARPPGGLLLDLLLGALRVLEVARQNLIVALRDRREDAVLVRGERGGPLLHELFLAEPDVLAPLQDHRLEDRRVVALDRGVLRLAHGDVQRRALRDNLHALVVRRLRLRLLRVQVLLREGHRLRAHLHGRDDLVVIVPRPLKKIPSGSGIERT